MDRYKAVMLEYTRKEGGNSLDGAWSDKEMEKIINNQKKEKGTIYE
jgi:hypothetical protein